jgi:hypothetical protein
VSTRDQATAARPDALKVAGCELVFLSRDARALNHPEQKRRD